MAEAKVAKTSSPAFGVDPFRAAWRLFTSVRFALGLIGFLALASLLGVLIPQLPAQMRGNPAAEAAWLNFQERNFGSFTEPMYRLGLFEVFRSPWFLIGLALLVISVCLCTANRFPSIWRNVTRPRTRVRDAYFERGQPVVSVAIADSEGLVKELRRRRYKVTTLAVDGTNYIFADRFPWAQLATFVSHLALILFLAGGLVTVFAARDQDILIGEGETRPVFSPGDPEHMQIAVEDAVGRFNESGFPLDYRSYIVVYKDGREVTRGVTTVNDPLGYKGFKFHQTAYFGDGAALRVRDLREDRLVFDEVFALTSKAAAPRVKVRDVSGNLLLDDAIVPTDFIAGVAGSTLTIPQSGRHFWIGARPPGEARTWQLVLFETAKEPGVRAVLDEGEGQDLGGGLTLEFAGLSSIPSVGVRGMPGTDAEVTAEMYDGPDGKILTLAPIGDVALILAPDQPVIVGDYEYTFLGQREFAGITVRRDPGSTFIWVATGLLLLGLMMTFYTPRRRLWGRIKDGEAAFRGLGGRSSAIEREIREVAHRASRSL